MIILDTHTYTLGEQRFRSELRKLLQRACTQREHPLIEVLVKIFEVDPCSVDTHGLTALESYFQHGSRQGIQNSANQGLDMDFMKEYLPYRIEAKEVSFVAYCLIMLQYVAFSLRCFMAVCVFYVEWKYSIV